MKPVIVSVVTLAIVAAYASAQDAPADLFEVMYGADQASFEQLKKLVQQGADVNAPIGFDRMLREGEDPASRIGTTWPLDIAVQRSQMDMVSYLLRHGAKLHGRELADCALFGRGNTTLEMATALLKSGADPNSQSNGFTALHWSAYKNNHALAALLVAHKGIKIDAIDADGETALMLAVARGSTEIAELLLKAGANPHIKNEQGQSAIAMLENSITKQQKVLSDMRSAAR